MRSRTAIQHLTEEKINRIENDIRELSLPYSFDTKEYPIEVIVQKFKPDHQPQSLFIPDYQRDLVWDPVRQSKFIESLYLGVPIPPILVAEMDESGSLEIIDGSQRIRTISRYVSDEFELQHLEEIESLNNTRFSQLPSSRQRKFKNISLRFHVITDRADLPVRADVFDRLNSNVKTLTASEIRKGAYSSSTFYQFVVSMANSEQFKRIVPAKKDEEREELALRFFAYSEKYTEFKHEVTVFLNRFVEEKNSTGFQRHQLETNFFTMLNFVNQNIPNGFKKLESSISVPRVRFEALSVGTHLALRINPNLEISSTQWIESKEFKHHTTSDASNNKNKLKSRIEFVRDCLLGRISSSDLTY